LFDGTKSAFGKKGWIPHSTEIYDASWADKLYRGLARNTSFDFELVCLVDDDYDFKEPIRSVPFNNLEEGWWAIREKYRSDICDGKRVTMGLDTIICGDVDEIFSYDDFFAVISDPGNHRVICNGVTIASTDFIVEYQQMMDTDYKQVYKESMMTTKKYNPNNAIPSEMRLLQVRYPKADRLDRIYPDKIFSYREHIMKEPYKLDNARIVYFHGEPKPPELNNEDYTLKLMEHWV